MPTNSNRTSNAKKKKKKPTKQDAINPLKTRGKVAKDQNTIRDRTRNSPVVSVLDKTEDPLEVLKRFKSIVAFVLKETSGRLRNGLKYNVFYTKLKTIIGDEAQLNTDALIARRIDQIIFESGRTGAFIVFWAGTVDEPKLKILFIDPDGRIDLNSATLVAVQPFNAAW